MFEIGSSKNAIRKRKSRVKHAEAHRRATFVAEYVRVKYSQLYEEADSFFNKLFWQYPLKRKLTITPEYTIWKAEVEKLNVATTTTTTTELHEVEKLNVATPTTTTTELHEVEKLNAATRTTTTTELHEVDACLSIPLMSPVDVQETRDIQMFQDIYPSITKEIDLEIIDQVVREIQETVPDFFDQDMDVMLNEEINEPSLLEQELSKY